jgi:hypothetical protein
MEDNNKSLELYQNFEHGGKTYKVEHAKKNKSCRGCAFCETGGSRCTLNRIENDVPECVGLHRHDGMDVIFVEVRNDEDDFIRKMARKFAEERYNTNGNFIELSKQDCFVDGFMAGVAFNSEVR